MTRRRMEGVCETLDDFGRGIIRVEGKAVFLPDVLPGEKVVFETLYQHGKLSSANVLERLSSSPFRVEPFCPHYLKCGGCQIMHLSYEKQLEYKREKVRNLFRKFASIDIDVEPTVGMKEKFHYRNKVQKPLRKIKGEIVSGFYQTSSHQFVPASDCPAESRLAMEVEKQTLALLKKFQWPVYDEDKETGVLRHVLIKTSSARDEALLTLVVTDPELKGRKEFAKLLMQKVPKLKGVVFNVNSRKTNVILGEKDIPIYGRSYIEDVIFEKSFSISTHSFYQTNPSQIENLYSLAIEMAHLNKDDVVLDSYCGTGTIGLSMADKVKKVVGVEIVKEAVHDAIINAKKNNVKNCTFINADCTKYMQTTKDRFSVVVMDPPRKGSTPEFLDALVRMKPERVVYISCDPVTLARDVSLIKSKYKIERIIPVDMFPNTLHVETVVMLSLKKADKH